MSGWNANRALQFKPIANALVPREGPKMVPITVPFGQDGILEFEIDLTLTVSQGKMDVVQAVFIDNTNGGANTSSVLTLTSDTTGQRLTLPAGYQGYFPLLAGQQPKFHVAATDAQPAYIAFLNVPVPAMIWAAGGGTNTVTADQGAPGAEAWPVDILSNGLPINEGNPLYITAWPGTPLPVSPVSSSAIRAWVCDGAVPAMNVFQGPGRLTAFSLHNKGAVTAYVHFWDYNDGPTTDVVFTVAIGPNETVSLAAATQFWQFGSGINMNAYIGPLGTDNTPVAAGDVSGFVVFQ